MPARVVTIGSVEHGSEGFPVREMAGSAMDNDRVSVRLKEPKLRRYGAGLPAALIAATVVLVGCARNPPSPDDADPSKSTAKVASVNYRSTIAPYTSLRPTGPSSWLQPHDSTAPTPKPGQ
jgi:hypothetical protein